MVTVLLPKGKGDYCGIGLMETIWKLVEVFMDKQFLAIKLHGCLHGFSAGRGMGTATMGVVHANVGQNVTPHNPSLGLFLYHFLHTMSS